MKHSLGQRLTQLLLAVVKAVSVLNLLTIHVIYFLLRNGFCIVIIITLLARPLLIVMSRYICCALYGVNKIKCSIL